MVRFPAEWEKHESVWISWPEMEVECDLEGYSIEDTYKVIVKEITQRLNLNVLVSNEKLRVRLESELKPSKDVHTIQYLVTEKYSIWARDFGPIFTVAPEGHLEVAIFGWSAWGRVNDWPEEEAREAMQDSTVAKNVASHLKLKTRPASIENSEKLLVSEGGDREFNGKGTLIVTEAVEFQRNPGLSRDQIENSLKSSLGVKKVIWMKRGVAEDGFPTDGFLPGGLVPSFGTSGHIDEYARFSDENTVILAHVTEEEAEASPVAKMSRDALEENFKILSAETDQDGNPLKVLRIPNPPIITIDLKPDDVYQQEICRLLKKGGHQVNPSDTLKMVLPASYCNFLVTNNLVLAPKYARENLPEELRKECERTDKEAAEVLSKAFPGREIVQIDVFIVNIGGGGIHCITQQHPAVRQ